MKTVTAGAHGVNNVVVDGSESVKFSFASTCLAMEVLEGEVTVALTDTAVAGDDETRTISEGISGTFPHQRMGVDTYYLTGTGKVNLWASNIGDVNPFEGKAKGGDGGGGRTETVLWENEGTTNPDTITLSEAWSDFDELVIVTVGAGSVAAQYETAKHTSVMVIGSAYTMWYNSETTWGTYIATSSTVFTKLGAGGDYHISKIIGIKYGSGGGTLGALAYKDTASGSYTPAGSVSVAQSQATYVYDGTTGLTTYTEAGAPSAAFTGTTENITVG